MLKEIPPVSRRQHLVFDISESCTSFVLIDIGGDVRGGIRSICGEPTGGVNSHLPHD
jgi:hypothetical protein